MEFKSLHYMLRQSAYTTNKPERAFLMRKTGEAYTSISYSEAMEQINAISAYLMHLGLQKGDKVAFILENSPEYIYFDQACMQIGCVNASIYPTLTESEIEYILNDSDSKAIVVGTHFLLKRVLKVDGRGTMLQKIITCFDYSPSGPDDKVISLEEVIKKGKELYPGLKAEMEKRLESIDKDDLATLIYTSGTTGVPKGVMLSHDNFMSNAIAAHHMVSEISSEDIFLSFLPLCHVYERLATYYLSTYIGSTIAFAQSIETIAKNILEVRPTVMATVPRLLEKIHDKVHKTATQGGGIKLKIFSWAFKVGDKKRLLDEDGKTPGPLLAIQLKLAQKLVFSKIMEKMGGRMRIVVSGGAAMPPHVGIFFKNLGVTVMEGFGLTETSPFMTINEYHRQVYGTVGRVASKQQVAIQNPDTKEIITIQTYESFDPNFECAEGEILMKGPNQMKGYWKKPEATAEVIDADGWFHTGDIGKFYKGYLKITDRLKNMLVNSLGKNIYPTPVENCYLNSTKIEQIFIIGDKREYVTAIIVSPKDELKEVFGLSDAFFEEADPFIRDEKIIKWVADDVHKLSNNLAKFERVKHFALKRTPFSVEAGEMSMTQKVKRKLVEQKYKDEIEKLYAEVLL